MQILFKGFSQTQQIHCFGISTSKNKLGFKTTEEYYKKIRNECGDFVLHNVDVTAVDKILENLDVAKASGIDQILAKFLKDGALVTTIHLANIINPSIKFDTLPSNCKIAKIGNLFQIPLFKKGIKLKLKNYRPISLLPLISKATEKLIHDQTQKIFKEMDCCTFANQALEQIILQIHALLA